MSLEGAYDPDNIFAKVARGEAPCAKVFEDADTIAFMDLFPQGRGHTLVIHKRAQARNLLDAEMADIIPIMATAQRVGRAIVKALKPDGLTVMQLNGEASGQTIFHLHFHLIPRWRATPLGRHAQGMADSNELARLAQDIARAIEP
ncbi:MAG TPA: HIT family protein [Caulobacteraceae bacterium]|jgi:histidine triad (HIT) family protein